MNDSIEHELFKCRQAADEGYRLASGKYDEIKNALISASNRLSTTDVEQNKIKRIQNTELVRIQKEELQQLVDRVSLIHGDLKKLQEQSQYFSIVVYGRTMAGKSTLMEILKHGDGKSIGKGAQRTTLDVRDYYWKGLKITDVPGISAFSQDAKEARIDENKALEAAKKADLILFLLTSDAPQPDEAKKLAQLKSFGKPVLGVINVKMSFNINDELDVEDLEEKMAQTAQIDAAINQFKKFAAMHNQDWSGIKFVATHLLSAYQSQGRNQKVFKISRFAEVEDFILDKVRNDGRFLRIKTFADSVAVPMSKIILKIYEQSASSLTASDIWRDKKVQLGNWSKKFGERANEKFDSLYKTLSEELDTAIYNFAESHYEDERVNEHWQQSLQSLKFDEKYQTLLKELSKECEDKRKELSDELTQELDFAFSGNTRTNIELEGTTPWGKYAAAVLPNLLLFIPGIGWGARIAIGVGAALLQFLFDDKQEKIREAKAKLRKDLKAPSHEVLDKMNNQAREIFNNEIWKKGIVEFWDLLAGYQFMLAQLGKSQYEMARKLFADFSDLNAKLLEEAIVYKGAGFISSVDNVARIPGENLVAFAGRANLNYEELSNLLGEKFSVVKPEPKIPETVQKVLDCQIEIKSYNLDNSDNPKAAYAAFLPNYVDATKFKLAQQIAGIPIIRR